MEGSKGYNIIFNDDEPDNWNRDLEAAKNLGGFLQTTHWDRMNQQLNIGKGIYVQITHNNKIKMMCMIVNKKVIINSFLKRLMCTFNDHFFEVGEGPVYFIDEPEEAEEILSYFLKELDVYRQQKKILYVSFTGSILKNTDIKSDILDDIYIECGYTNQLWQTLMVDLNPSEEIILSSFNRNLKRNIKKYSDQEMSVVELENMEDIDQIFWKYYCQFNNMDYNKGDYNKYLLADYNKYYHFFVVEVNNEVLAVLGMYCFNGVATEVMSGLSNKAIDLKLPAQDILHWEMIKRAKALKCQYFDLAGINPNPLTQKEKGISQFKLKYSKEIIEFHKYRKYYGFLKFVLFIKQRVKKIEVGKNNA